MWFRRAGGAVVLAAAASLTLGGVASAHDEPHDDPPVSTPAGGVAIGDGIFLTGGVVIPPDDGPPRPLDAYHTAVFVQSWLATAFFGGRDVVRDPPPELPVYRVDATGDWAGNPGTVTVYFATDGTTPYVAFPGMLVWEDPAAVPPPSNWFIAPPRAIDAFNGEADLIPTLGVEMATSTTTSPEDDADGEAAGEADPVGSTTAGSADLWPWLAVGAVAVGVGAGGIQLRRRAKTADDAPR